MQDDSASVEFVFYHSLGCFKSYTTYLRSYIEMWFLLSEGDNKGAALWFI